MRKKYVTLKDVANYLGVSTTTVYKALKGHPDISRSTRDKVIDAINKLGYIKNDAASSLRSSKTFTIGFIVYGISNPFYEPVIRGMTHAAEDKGYDLLTFPTSENTREKLEKALETMMKKRVDGLIIAADVTLVDKNVLRKYRLRTNSIAFGLMFKEIQTDVISPNNFKGGYIATKHLLEIGRKRIAMLHTFDFSREKNLRERYQGYVKALKEYGLKPDKKLLFVESKPSRREDSMCEAYKIVRKKLKEIKFDAIFCYNDEVAYGALEALKDEGVKVPEEVAVVGYDDLEFSKIISPPLTSVTFDKYLLGYRSVEMLVERIENPEMDLRAEFIDVDLAVRESTIGGE